MSKVYVVGVGMSKFTKPGDIDYTDDVVEAVTKALIDANLTYDDIKYAAVGYCYAESTSGQRALYNLGLTQIPIVNVNNNCSTGSTALYLARQAVRDHGCCLAVGFEKMARGSLGVTWTDRTNPLDKTYEIMSELRGMAPAPPAPQIFGNAGLEYLKDGPTDSLDWIAYKSHCHSTLNPYAQFRKKYTLEQVKNARTVFGPMTLLHCSPTSNGAAAAILCSEEFVKKHNLGAQAVEIVGQEMATDSTKAFDPEEKSKSCLEIAGADMTRRAMRDLISKTRVPRSDIKVVELHDCFSANELVTIDALGFCEPGKAAEFVLSGTTTLPQFSNSSKPSTLIVNPSGGLISKGHPLGATGLAQCCELTWQLRGWAGDRQVQSKYALQHNIGLGGAVVITLYKKADLQSDSQWKDPRQRFGYNPALEARPVSANDVKKVMARQGSLLGTRNKLHDEEKYASKL